MKFDPKRLKILRVENKLTAVKLAEKIRKTSKTIQRWENPKGKMASAPEDTVIALAKVLDVDVDVLTGVSPLPKMQGVGATSRRLHIGAKITPRTRNAYALTRDRYDVTPTQVIELAPLLFTLIAEGCLDYRREKIEKAEPHIDALNKMAHGYSSYLCSQRAADGVFDEQESISKRDIFGNHIGQDAYDFGYYQLTENPFAEYLKHLAQALTDKAAVHYDDEEDWKIDEIPFFTLCRDEIQALTEGDEELTYMVADGDVDLWKLPKDLRHSDKEPADKTKQRIEWIRSEAEMHKEKLKEINSDFISQY